jgi:hypothetical protein
LSVSSIRRFVEPAFDFLDLFNSSIWSSLSRRLILPVSPEISNGRISVPEIRGRLFAPNSDSPLHGIIWHLASTSGGNLHDLDVVFASASSVHSSYEAKFALDLQNRNSHFLSQNEANRWIRYDFNNLRVVPTHYSILSNPIQSNPGQPTDHDPRSWCLEVSDDGNEWTEVHRCTDNSDVKGKSLIGTYEVSKSVKCRFVRLRQTGKNHYNCDRLILSGLEIYSTLFEG